MYQSFKVKNFRCFREFTLEDLKRVNLIAGMNNVGKTALLEAFFIHCGAYNPELTLRVNTFRGIEILKFNLGRWVETLWDSFFSEFDISKKIELIGNNEKTGQRLVYLKALRQPEELEKFSQYISSRPSGSEGLPLSSQATRQVLELGHENGQGQRGSYYMIFDQNGIHNAPLPPSPPFPAFFLAARVRVPHTEDAERFGKLDIIGRQDVLVKALQLVEPRIRRLAVVVAGGVPMIHGDIGSNRMVPLPLMGEGMVRLASLVLAISNAQDGFVLIDEIENGLHHSILPKLWLAIGEVSRQFNTQVFATTHSNECIAAAHKAFRESDAYDFRLHRLERIKETILAVTYDQETLEAAIETGLEVR